MVLACVADCYQTSRPYRLRDTWKFCTAEQQNDSAYPVGRATIKKVLCTDRTGGQISTFVLLELSQIHAAVALHAVAHIPA